MNPTPDEVLTLFHCPGCEVNGLIGDAEPREHPDENMGDQLKCHRCGAGLSAQHIYDYVDVQVVEYGG